MRSNAKQFTETYHPFEIKHIIKLFQEICLKNTQIID